MNAMLLWGELLIAILIWGAAFAHTEGAHTFFLSVLVFWLLLGLLVAPLAGIVIVVRRAIEKVKLPAARIGEQPASGSPDVFNTLRTRHEQQLARQRAESTKEIGG